jgi:hypothetical protein
MDEVPNAGERERRAQGRARWAALWLERWAAGHLKGCPQAIPEARDAIFIAPCACEEIRRDAERST